MMARDLALLAIGVVAASQVPKLLAVKPANPPAALVQQAKAQAPAIMGAYTVEANSAGHFEATFLLNGKAVDGVIDTGATFVAINESTARRLGFTGNGLDFRYAVNTANGPAEAAHVMLDRVEIGGVRSQGVDAFVLRDTALGQALIGMSFLKKLKSYGAENGRMVLKQ